MRRCIGQIKGYPLTYENGEPVKSREFIERLAESISDRSDRACFIADATRVRYNERRKES